MENRRIEAVFFDCWDTLISFTCEQPRWNILSLEKHCMNHDSIDWKEVFDFSENFFRNYYQSRLLFELDILAILSLFQKYFGMELDCSIEECSHEILCYLSPKPIEGIDKFLSFLEEKKVPYYVLSNTIYSTEDSMRILKKLIPDHEFGFFLGSKEVGVKKPNPLFFKTGTRLAKKDITHSMYIGDAFFQDVIGSTDAGFATSVWLNHKKKERRCPEGYALKRDCLEVSSYSMLIEKIKENGIL